MAKAKATEVKPGELASDRVVGKAVKEDGIGTVMYQESFRVEVTLVGESDLLCHRYDIETVEAKGKAKKNSIEKKSDNTESYLYRCTNGDCGMPAMNLKASICDAAKRIPDPSSPRKSARDLFRAGILVHGDQDRGQLSTFGQDKEDYMDKRKVNVQRAAVPRSRPAFLAGWKLTYIIEVIAPEYIDESMLHKAVTDAGRYHGLGDYRPDFGRFRVESFKILKDADTAPETKKGAASKRS